MVHGMKLLRCF